MVSVGSVASIFRIIFVIALLCEGSPGSCPKCEQCGKFAKLLPSITAALEQYVRLLYKASRSYNCAIETKKDCFKLASKTSRWTENALKICNISAGSTVDYLLWFDSVSGFPHRLQIQTKISSLSNRHLSSAGITLKSARTLGSRIAHAKSMNPRSLWSGRRLRKLPKPLKRQHSARFDDETAISETMTQKSRDSEPGALRRKSFNSDDEGVEVSNADVTGDETRRKIRNVPGSAASRTRSRKLSRLPKNQSSAPSDGGMKMNNDETGMSETMSQNSMDSTSGASRRKSFNSDDEAVEVSNADVTGDETKRKIRNVPGSLASRRRSRKMPRLVRNQSSAPSDDGMKMNNDETAMRETMSQKSRDSRSGASRQKTSNSDDEEVEASNADVTGDETKQKIRNIPGSVTSKRRSRILSRLLMNQFSAPSDDGIKMNNDENEMSETMPRKSRKSRSRASRRKSFNSDDEGVETSNTDVAGDETRQKVRNVPGSVASRRRSRKLSRLLMNQSSDSSDDGMKMNNDETAMSETMSQKLRVSKSGASHRKSLNSDDEEVKASNADVKGDEIKQKVRNVPGPVASRRRSRKLSRLVMNQSSASSDDRMKMNSDENAMSENMPRKSRDSRSKASRRKSFNSDDEEVEASNVDVTGDETKQKIRNIPGSITSKRRSRILSRLLMNQFSAPSDDGIKMNNDENEMSETMPRKSRESRSRASRRKSFNSDDEGVETGNADVAGDEIRQKVRNVPGSVTSKRRSRILSRLLMNQFSAPSDDGMKMNNDETAMSETMPRKSRDSRSRASRRKSFNSDNEGVEASSADVTEDGSGRQRPIFSGSVPFRRRLRKLPRLPMHRSLKPFDGGRKMNNDESAASETMPQTLRDSESGGSRRKSFSSNDEEDPMDNADDTEGEIRQRVRYVPDLARLERRLRKLPLALKHKYFVPSDDGTKMNNEETAMGESTPQTVTDSDSESSETQTAMPQSTSAPVNDEVSMEDAGVTMNEITPPPVKDFKKNESCQGTLWIPSPIQEPVVSIPTPWISSVEPTIQINDTLVVHGHLAFNKKKFGVTVWSGTVNPTLEDIVFVILFQVDHYKVMHKTFGSGLWKRIETGELDEPLNGNFVFKLSYQNVDNQPTWVISVGSSKQSQTIRTKPIAPLDDGRKMYSVHGDIRITSLYWTGRKVTHPHVGFPEGKLPIGQRLVVHGIPRSETFTFDFDSTLNANDIPLHFRKSSENVGRNNRRKDVWGKGEIGGGQPFRTGVPTTIVFYKAAKEMLIFVDNVLKYRYKHRLLPGEDYRGVTQWEHFDTGGIHIMIC